MPTDSTEPVEDNIINESYRRKLVDWIIQVFRALKKSSTQTFLTSMSIIDRYFLFKRKTNESLGKLEMHELGLTAILMSSKLEDVRPIHMQQIIEDAGHNKFSQ